MDGNTEPTVGTAHWECFCDPAYFDLWAVRPAGDTSFDSQQLFHVRSQAEAEALRDTLSGLCDATARDLARSNIVILSAFKAEQQERLRLAELVSDTTASFHSFIFAVKTRNPDLVRSLRTECFNNSGWAKAIDQAVAA